MDIKQLQNKIKTELKLKNPPKQSDLSEVIRSLEFELASLTDEQVKQIAEAYKVTLESSALSVPNQGDLANTDSSIQTSDGTEHKARESMTVFERNELIAEQTGDRLIAAELDLEQRINKKLVEIDPELNAIKKRQLDAIFAPIRRTEEIHEWFMGL